MKIDFGEPDPEGEAKRLFEALKESIDQQKKRMINDTLIVDIGEMGPDDVLKFEFKEAKPFTMPIDYVEIKQEKIVVCKWCKDTLVLNGKLCVCTCTFKNCGISTHDHQEDRNQDEHINLVLDLDKSEYHYTDEEVDETQNPQTTQMERYHGKE